MKIKTVYLDLSRNKLQVEKFLLYQDYSIKKQMMRYVENNLTTDQLRKFIEIKSFEKVFRDKYYECVVKFRFTSFGDVILEIVHFHKREMYKEMKQQRIRNYEKGIIDDDTFF